MSWVRVAIIGTGTDDDPYRPDLPTGIEWRAQIPSNADGSPRLADSVVWVSDDRDVDVRVERLSEDDAIAEMQRRVLTDGRVRR